MSSEMPADGLSEVDKNDKMKLQFPVLCCIITYTA